MAILSQILGTSFNRAPVQMSPIHMPGINIPAMAPDANANAYHTTDQGQQGQQPVQGQGQQQGQSIDDVINGFKARLDAMRGGGGTAGGNAGVGGAQGIGPEPAPVPVPPAAAAAPPAAMPAAVPAAGAAPGGGVMNSIMGAFNAGAGGGLDLSKLASLLPMLGL